MTKSPEMRRVIRSWIQVGLGMVAVYAAIEALRHWGWIASDRRFVQSVFAILALAFGLSVVAERFPTGAAQAGVRLLCAAFCRTILPLLAILGWGWYSSHSFTKSDGVVLAAGYFVPFAICVVLAVREQSKAVSSAPINLRPDQGLKTRVD